MNGPMLYVRLCAPLESIGIIHLRRIHTQPLSRCCVCLIHDAVLGAVLGALISHHIARALGSIMSDECMQKVYPDVFT